MPNATRRLLISRYMHLDRRSAFIDFGGRAVLPSRGQRLWATQIKHVQGCLVK